VMQLPPTDEIVMVAGTPPIRAKKARYFEDPQFQARILTPSESKASATRHADDWSARTVPRCPDISGVDGQADEVVAGDTQHEKRKQPELDQAQTPERARPIENEFEPDLNKPSDNRAAQLQLFDQQARRAAQTASLDPDDGIKL
jgi:type IV secretion system protein VirD4